MTRREFTGAGSGMCAVCNYAGCDRSFADRQPHCWARAAEAMELAVPVSLHGFYSAPYSPQLLPLSPLGPLVQPTWRNPLPQGARRREGLLVPRHSALPTVEPRREGEVWPHC